MTPKTSIITPHGNTGNLVNLLVDDPYETPVNPELRIDTTDLSPDEAAQEVLICISQKGFIYGR